MPRAIPALRLPDLTGRRALVTGGSDGIGLHIVRGLAAAGAEVILPVRDPRKGERAVAWVRERVPASRISLRRLELSSQASVSELGDELRREGAPLHLLINNAGVMTPPTRQTSIDGAEIQFATNHLGHFALVMALLPLLRDGAARVTSQVSVAADEGAINWEDLNWERGYDAMRAYSQSKIALGLFGLELDRRSRAEGWGITSNLSHPGIAPTNLLSAQPEMGRTEDTRSVRVIRWLSARGILVGTPETAAMPALFAAASPSAVGGRLYGPKGPGHLGGPPAEQRLYSRLRDEEHARRVWEFSERLVRSGP